MEFFEYLKTYLNEKEIDLLKESLSLPSKHAVLLNTQKMEDETFLSLFPNVQPHPIVKHAFIYDKNEYDLGKSIYHLLGCFYLQEPSAMVPSYLLNPQENELVLDMCAAPGGKTIQASFLMNDTGLIIANDLSKSRALILSENVERLGIGNVVVTSNDLSLIYKNHLNCFHKIILDAPCSGSGMFRKEEKMVDDWSYAKVLKNQEIQKQLILIAFDMLSPGGTLCYSTCSYSEEEDEDVASYLLENRDATIKTINHPSFFINEKKPLGFHLLPSHFTGEGHYICLIEKPGNYSLKTLKNEKKDHKYGIDFSEINKFGDTLFGLNYSYNFRGFNIVRAGVKIGELIKNEIKYDYHYSHYVKDFPRIYDLNNKEIDIYLSGNVLPVNIDKGYYLLKYQGINVDIAKADGRVIKNHFPKGLRIIKR